MSDQPPPQPDYVEELRSKVERIRFDLDNHFTREHCDGNKGLLKKRQELQMEREALHYRFAEQQETDRVEATKRQALESGLVESLVATQETGTCPLCFDEIPTIIPATQCAKDSQVFHRYWCCGAIACIPCVEQREQRVMGVQERVDNGEVLSRDELEEFNLELASFGQCPFCRTPNIDNKHLVSQLQRNVEAGKAWAYYELGHLTEGGTKMVTLDRWKAAELFQKAAELGHVVAMGRLGEMYGVGFPELGMPPDREKEREYLLKAARLGYFRSQFQYAHSVLGDDNEESLIWYTLCAAQGSSTAQSALGDHFLQHDALFRSLYWYKKAALQGEPLAQMKLSSGLLNGKAMMCDGQIDLAGNSAVPEACFWFNLNADEYEGQPGWQRDEPLFLRHCGRCGQSGSTGTTGEALRRCAKCLGVRYCSRECQVAHWKMGHKIDCLAVQELQKMVKVQSDEGYAYPVPEIHGDLQFSSGKPVR